MQLPLRAVVAGHLCLDVIPRLDHLNEGEFFQKLRPGRVITTGPAVFSTGGTVSNTGLSLFKLGVPVRLVGKVGKDPFGELVRAQIAQVSPALAEDIRVDPASSTSYTLVFSPADTDRMFLHCPGVNDTFCSDDIDWDLVRGADVFHFGYPPDMRCMYMDGGAKLQTVYQRARECGATTSLDTSLPDPASEAGRQDWQEILRRTLPLVDIYLPSLVELLFLLRRPEFERLVNGSDRGSSRGIVSAELLSQLGRQVLDMGVGIVMIKLGEHGAYLQSAGPERLARMGRAAARQEEWSAQELWVPGFQASVAGTTGAGDAAIAGFFSAFLRGLGPWQSLNTAMAVGACSVEAVDSLSAVRSWEETQARIAAGWERSPIPEGFVGRETGAGRAA